MQQTINMSTLHLLLHLKELWPGHSQVFFCKYNDPIYVKMEKLEIMIALASDHNVDQVLLEFKEYATEVDVDFVRKVNSVICLIRSDYSRAEVMLFIKWRF